ncbi:hypothetical protein OHA74_54875 [Streptomyces phaeochromogenes]|uniref:hypothetical protein n=1 Tax=Streptomyces phaeochromogenes TaxID=1923 RepID=UPI002E2B4C6E|nr:hypothetical protein [Streptomyces phaeochromogenes]
MIKSAEVGVGEFAEALLARVREARADLAAAVETEDAYAASVAQSDLDDVVWLARRHGIDIEADEE